jgi:Flp pilus assembly protein CpaB
MEALKHWARGPRVRAWGPIFVALLVGGAVFWEVRAAVVAGSRRLSDPRYLVAARDLALGLPVSLSDLSFRHADSEPVPKGAITDQELHLLSDSAWARPLGKGDWVTWSVVAAAHQGVGATVPRGMRAHGLELKTGPQVFPKDRIDVLWLPSDPRNPAAGATLIVENVQVLRVKRDGARQSLVLAVTPDDIPVLEKAAGSGTLSLSVRNPEEATDPARRRRGSTWLRGRSPNRRVEVWTDKT